MITIIRLNYKIKNEAYMDLFIWWGYFSLIGGGIGFTVLVAIGLYDDYIDRKKAIK
jgi:hypothetical protein